MADKPSFLIGVDETPAEAEITDVLRDEPIAEDKNENNDNPTPSAGDTPDAPVVPADGSGSEPTPGADAGAGSDVPADGDASAGGDKSDTPTDGGTPADKKAPEETPEQAAARQVNLKFGTFKSAEDAEAAFKEMQRTLTKLSQNKQTTPQPGQQPGSQPQDNLSKFSQLAKTQPLVDVKLPKSELYKFDDGSIDLDGYSRDLVRNVVMSIQQSLIGGQLGAMQFCLLQEAMGQDFQEARGAQEHTAKAATVEQKILTTYPIFKTNTQASDLLETTIYGEVAKRNAAAQKAGKEPEPLTEEDFMKLAETLVKNLNIPVAPQVEDTADTPHRSPTMQPTGAPRLSGVDADIDGMMRVKSKSGSIF